ncbi:MAG: transketolase family protein [Nitrospinae bacterium]|nr:transketolase family protein [Nitrospinota bacterium]
MKNREKKSLRDAYGATLAELGAQNRNIVALDADLSGSTRTSVFAAKFPDRFFNMGVAEQDMISTAAGLAAAGKIPFASSFAIFASGRAWEQVRQSVCLSNLNVKIVATHGGITVGEDGPSHQALEDLTLMRVLPNMTVIVPCDAVETAAVMRRIADTYGPVYVRVAREKFPVIFDADYKFNIGKGVILRHGSDVAIIACGYLVSKALEAAEELAEEGISAAVVNMPTIKPLDEDLVIQMASTTGAIVTAEEHSITGGLGSAVMEVVCENEPVPVIRVGMKGRFGSSGKPEELMDYYGMNAPAVAEAARRAMALKTGPVQQNKKD